MSLKSKLVYLNSLVAKFYYIPSLLAWVVTLWRETSSTNQIRIDLESAKIILVHQKCKYFFWCKIKLSIFALFFLYLLIILQIVIILNLLLYFQLQKMPILLLEYQKNLQFKIIQDFGCINNIFVDCFCSNRGLIKGAEQILFF